MGQRRGCGLASERARCLGPRGGGCRGSCGLTSGHPPPAVQEERQRGKDRGEGEVESTSSANEDMPVEKILEAELAVEPKTETYVEASVGLNPSSVSALPTPVCSALGAGALGARPGGGPRHPITALRLEGDPVISSPPPGRGTPSSHHPPRLKGDPVITPHLGGGPHHHTLPGGGPCHHPLPGSTPGRGTLSSPPTWEGDPVITHLLGARLEGDPVTPRPTSTRLCCPSGGQVFGSWAQSPGLDGSLPASCYLWPILQPGLWAALGLSVVCVSRVGSGWP